MEQTETNSAPLKQLVYRSVMADLINGEYKPGDILNEKKLIEKYGVSKSPVRDALVELCNENVLRGRPRFGYEVVAISERDIREILVYRCVLETECLRRGMPAIRRDGLRQLRQTVREQQQRLEQQDVLEHWNSNILFHIQLASYCGNRYMVESIQKSMHVQTRAYGQHHFDRWNKPIHALDVVGHLNIIDALDREDLELAVSLLEEDVLSFAKGWFW